MWWYTILNKIGLKLLIILAFFAIFATSTEPLIIDNNLFIMMFSWGFSGQSIIHNLSLGIIVSWIFYFFVVHIPEKKRQRDLTPFISDKIFKITREIASVVTETAKFADTDKLLSTLSKEDFQLIFDNIPASSIGRISSSASKPLDVESLDMYILNSINRVRDNIDELFTYITFIDSNILREINDLRHSRVPLHPFEIKIFTNAIRKGKGKKSYNSLGHTIYFLYQKCIILQRLNKTVYNHEYTSNLDALKLGSNIYCEGEIIENFKKNFPEGNVSFVNNKIEVETEVDGSTVLFLFDEEYNYYDLVTLTQCIKKSNEDLIKLNEQYKNTEVRSIRFKSPYGLSLN
ncbi:hypothetical protein AB4151_22470 [Vibrio splendidus]|uniref:Uncharacterized protein n=2 Tax=Vibrio splendidus TaxID=29497 RepID=A0A2N7CBK5_VIBSP|nr:hypothetical protein [Vibrio splendidus]PMF19364.1 hypothetical protein BCV19_13320 [Vibrio splendidus]